MHEASFRDGEAGTADAGTGSGAFVGQGRLTSVSLTPPSLGRLPIPPCSVDRSPCLLDRQHAYTGEPDSSPKSRLVMADPCAVGKRCADELQKSRARTLVSVLYGPVPWMDSLVGWDRVVRVFVLVPHCRDGDPVEDGWRGDLAWLSLRGRVQTMDLLKQLSPARTHVRTTPESLKQHPRRMRELGSRRRGRHRDGRENGGKERVMAVGRVCKSGEVARVDSSGSSFASTISPAGRYQMDYFRVADLMLRILRSTKIVTEN